MSACPRRPLARLAKDVLEVRRGPHEKIAWASLDSSIVQPMRATPMQTTDFYTRVRYAIDPKLEYSIYQSAT
jgi:hypothetical protein